MPRLRIKSETLFSPLGIFFIYILAAGLAVMCFRLFIPGENPPLAIFSLSWRLIRGLLTYLDLFPALALSALVIPFGFKVHEQEKITPFSPQFLQYLKMPIVTAIVATIMYGLIYFLFIPLAQNYEADLRFRGNLYRLAREQAQEYANTARWAEAAQFLAICDTIWPDNDSPDISRLRTETEIRLEEQRLGPPLPFEDFRLNPLPFLPEARAISATEALQMAETALDEERFFDAHWFATLGGQVATPNSIEVTTAARLAGLAWEGINSLSPNEAEVQAHMAYQLKRSGYIALQGNEWIRAYHLLLQHQEINPRDPDVARFLPMAEAGVRQVAFFLDEMELTMGRMLSGAIFSLPSGNGRMVMRVSSLSTFPDFAEGIGLDLMAFDRTGRPIWSIEAPYVKFLPITLNSGPAVSALFRAVSLATGDIVWQPIVRELGQSVADPASAILQLSWNDFLLLADINRGITALSPQDIRRAAERLGAFGYLPQIFESELLERFIRPLFLLPFGIMAIALGWRYRARKHPRYMAVPMLGIIPVVFYGTIHFSRSLLGNLGIWTVVSLGFIPAAIIFSAGLLIMLVLSLIILAAQHG